MITLKTISFSIMHFAIAFSVVWLLTGDVVIGGMVAMIEPAVNSIGYFFHEKAWSRYLSRHSGKDSRRNAAIPA